MNVVVPEKTRCRSSYQCVRSCPVKAVRIQGGVADIVQERCIGCGACVTACSQGGLRFAEEIARVRGLLSSARVVAIVPREYVAALNPATPAQVEAGLLLLGFHSVEDTLLGEELVASQYDRLDTSSSPLVRSTCPAAVALVLRYHPSLASHLAPVISPMIAQGRLVKKIYGEGVATVYIGPCGARKAEAREDEVADAIDAVLTFDELESMLADSAIDLAALPSANGEKDRPLLFKESSLVDGFPRGVVAKTSMLDTRIRVARGTSQSSDLLSGIERGDIDSAIVDISACNGCLDGPAIQRLSLLERKRLVVDDYESRRETAGLTLRFEDLRDSLPEIEWARSFEARPVEEQMPSVEEIARILAQGERCAPEEQLDCGACGYETCREQAEAISKGLAEWDMCHPLQRRLLTRLVERLRELSTTDGLTGLVNHRTFTERLEEELHRVERYSSLVSVLMVDVDLFKGVNDSLGHVCGDQVLVAIGKTIAKSVRGSDIVSRWGGDEFGVILPETDKTQGFAVAEKLRAMIEAAPISVDSGGNETDLRMTVSIGIATSEGPKSSDDLVTEADRALYLAKSRGRNRVELGAGVEREMKPESPEEG